MADLIQPGIADERGQAFDTLVAESYDALDLTRLLIYRIAEVNADALPHLGWQFHVTGIEGWDLASSEADRRALIARAIELHRYKGTPWAVKTALTTLGFGEPTLIEGIGPVRRDGEVRRNGAIPHAVQNRWAVFDVAFDLGERGLAAGDGQRMVALVQTWKNARSHLRRITFRLGVTDTVAPTDVLHTVGRSGLRDNAFAGLVHHDGACARNGTVARCGPDTVAMTFSGRVRRNGKCRRDGAVQRGQIIQWSESL
jgi:Phage tail protein (Tail_P2_I)